MHSKSHIRILRLLSVILVITILSLTGCSSGYSPIDYTGIDINTDDSENAIQNLTVYYSSGYDLASLNPYRIEYGDDGELMANLYDGLVVYNDGKECEPGVATSWEANDDYTTWTFHLRDDSYWVDVNGEIQDRVTSYDFITGLEWCLNYSKGEAITVQLSTHFVEGASDYLNYTSELSDEEARTLPQDVFLDMVGIEAPDEDTVVYHLTCSCPYFDSVVAFVEFLPTPQKLIDEIGIDGYIINSNLDAWFNGPYIMTEYIPYNERILDANPHWYGNDDNTRFMSITYKAVESTSIALQLYENNELDRVDLLTSQLNTILNDPDNEYNDYLVSKPASLYPEVLMFNFNKNLEDGTPDVNWNLAAANENFRLSWYYGLDIYSLLRLYDPIDPYNSETDTIIAHNLAFTSDGTDYADIVESLIDIKADNSEGIRRLDDEKFLEYKNKAIEELTAQGVTFPIEADFYINSSSQSALDYALLLKSAFSESLGDDYVKVNILTYVSSYYREVVMPLKYSFDDHSWASDYSDPSGVLEQYILGGSNAYMADYYGLNDVTEEEINGSKSYLKDVLAELETYSDLYEEANSICDDMDARYRAFAEAEAYLLNHGIVLPYYEESGYCLTRLDVSDLRNLASGCFNTRYVNVGSNSEGCTNDIWEEDEN